MATSSYFNNQNNTAQQELAEALIIQAIQHRGVDVKFIPAETVDNDDVFNEALETRFASVSDIEMYIEDITSYNGSGDLYQAFGGFTMTDNATLVVSQKRFGEEVSTPEPVEGDLIYIPYANLMFQVDKLLEDEDFRQWGKNYVYRIRATKYAYGHEDLETGDPDIDEIMSLDLEDDMNDGEVMVVPDPASVNNVNQHAQDETETFNLDFGDK